MSLVINLGHAVAKFMRIGGQNPGTFDAKQMGLYTGLQLEAMAEKLEVICAGNISFERQARMRHMIECITQLSNEFKANEHYGAILRCDYEQFLDADLDLAWVSLGSAESVSPDAMGATGEVIRANLDKFPDGVVTRDANGKVVKPAGWRAHDLSPFVPKKPE